MSLFDNAFNINVNNVRLRDIQILLVNFTYWPTDVMVQRQSVVETDIQNVTHLAIHTKLPAFKTVIAMTLLWNRAQNTNYMVIHTLNVQRTWL